MLYIRLLKKALFFSAFFYVSVLCLPAVSAFPTNCPPLRIDESVRVNYVYDGDTFQLEDGRKIRLLGIDTPEVFSQRYRLDRDIQAAGEKAKAALRKQLNTSRNRVSLALGDEAFDRYGRTLGHVYLPNGQNIQAWLIEQGLAIAFTTPPNDRMSACYRKIEDKAREAKKGIWQLAQYAVKSTRDLNQESEGFHRIEGRVTRVWQKSHSVILHLDGELEIKIFKRDLYNFDIHMLNTLQGKKVRVRGWPHVNNDLGNGLINSLNNAANKLPYRMQLRHRDAIKVIH